ncbi:fumarylacetoacetate hydrolase family protein [Microbacterium sp. A196]|uniref:fumarylacetoacetate hydrolase family protein n=1 Tax=Microbacterium sp. A196 TaxID=3457320 RepID=UPI003FD49202
MQETVKEADPATGLREGTFGISTLAERDRSFPAIVRPDGSVVDVSDRYRDTHAIFDDWERGFDVLADAAANDATTGLFQDYRPAQPLSHPNLLCSGANYKQHVAEMLTKNKFNQHNRHDGESNEDFFARNYAMMEVRSREGTPFFWTGLHSSLVGAHDDIVLPVLGEQPDWELELGVVVGKSGRFVSVEEAEQLIAGYVMVNDLGTVDLFRRTDIPWGYDWVGKHQPTFKPAGPFIVPAQFINPDELTITLRVNGEVMQDWPANDMIFNPAQVLTYASERVHLTPGDMLLMGSPPGNGMHHGQFLTDGDVVESEITYLGRQRNLCVQEDIGAKTPVFGNWENVDA